MIVDAHHHLWRDPGQYPWLNSPRLGALRRPYTMKDLLPRLSAATVAGTVLVEGGRCDDAEAGELLDIARAHNSIAAVVAWADLSDPGLADTLAALREHPGGDLLAGIRAQVQREADPDWLDRPNVRRGLTTLAAAGLTYDLVVRADQLPSCQRVAAAIPQLRLVLDHLGSPPITGDRDAQARWRGQLTALARFPNVSAKLSGLVTHADWATWTTADLRPFVAIAVELFGAHRLMFGSDWPYCLVAAGYQTVMDTIRELLAELSAAERDAVFADTAIGVYSLPRRPARA